MSEVTIIWREWFNADAVKRLTEMGTLPRNKWTTRREPEDGEEAARLIAKDIYDEDPGSFGNQSTVVILEPEQFAGTYDVDVEYDPTFSATKRQDGETP